MNMLILSDGDSKTDLARYVRERIDAIAIEKGHSVFAVELKRDEVPACNGCLYCITRHPGVCVHHEAFAGIIECSSRCQAVIFLTPVVFGTFSSPVKNAIDRGGLLVTNHRSCIHLIIGYASDATGEERSTFLDMTAKHRGEADIVHLGVRERFKAFFAGTREEGDAVCQSIRSFI